MNLIKTTQAIMPRPRDDYFKDFDKFESLLSGIPVEGITDYENDRLTSSLCQLFIEKYNEEITDEHAKNYKPVQKHTTLVLTVFLSMVEDGGEFPSTVFFYPIPQGAVILPPFAIHASQGWKLVNVIAYWRD